MNQTEFNSRLRSEVSLFKCPGRVDSAAFLAWYLNNFFRIDQQDAIDCICDSINDKGIDGIYVDDDDEEIYLFQSKLSPKDNRDQGDNDLRNFIGAKQWFNDEKSLNKLIASTASLELKALVTRLNLIDKIRLGYNIYLQFVTNKIFDTNAKEFLKLNPSTLEGYDLLELIQKYTYIAEKEIQTAEKTLSLNDNSKIIYNLPNGIIARVYSIPVKELLKLDGIDDRTLFYRNVRYGLGKTRVNKEIKKTILDHNEHKNIFLYHNGITLICDILDETVPKKITIRNYSIINGCQSMLTFYENRNKLSDEMNVLVKIIKLQQDSPLIQKTTYFANNQNAISLKDLKSNDRVQRGLQNEFFKIFNNSVLYRIKRGEPITGYTIVIDIDFAAQLIEAFYMENPHNTHLKSTLFSERYNKIFSKNIDASKIFLAYLIYHIIENNINNLKNEQVRGYGLAKFFFSYLIGAILKEDQKGKEILINPAEYVTLNRTKFVPAIEQLWKLISPEINAYIDEYTEGHNGFFDYKNLFKNSEYIKSMCRRIKMDHEKILIRHPEDAFYNLYK